VHNGLKCRPTRMGNPNCDIFGEFCTISPLSSAANIEFVFVLSNDFNIDLFSVKLLIFNFLDFYKVEIPRVLNFKEK
jgi:hypothetical protein